MSLRGTVEIIESETGALTIYLGGWEGEITFAYRVEFNGTAFGDINMEEYQTPGLSIPEWPPTPIERGFALEGATAWLGGDVFWIREAKYLKVSVIEIAPEIYCSSFDIIYTNPAGKERVIQNVTKYSWAPTPPPPEEIRRRIEKWLKEPTSANATDFLGMFDDAKNTIGDTIEDIAPVKPPRPPDLFKK